MKSEGGAKESEALHGRVRVLEELLQSKEQAVQDQAAKLELMLAQSQTQASLLRALVAATDPSHQQDFFHAVVYHLAAALNLAYAVIGEIGAKGESAGRVETNAVWANGDFAPNFTYDLLGMPCAHLLQERFFYCEAGVQQRFPQAQLIKDLGVEGYCGVQIFSSSHTLIGVLALLDTKPLHLSPEVISLLTLFASRVGSEFDRRRAEQAREKAMSDLQNIMDTVPDFLFTLDLEGNLTQWNSQVRKVTGYSSEELLKKPALAFVPTEEGEQTAAAIRQALTTGYAELEGHLLTKDERTIPFHWTGAALKDEQGRIVGISGVGRDVSEQRRTQEKQARQRRQLVAAQALAHLGSWDWDIDSGGVQWSDEQFRIFGHEPGAVQVTYDTVLASLLPDDHDRVLAALNEALLGRSSYDIEYRIVRPSGEIRTLHSRGEVMRDETGHPLAMAGATLDVTERKLVEESLRASEERWQLAVRGSNDGIWDWNIQTGAVFFSSRWKTMRGFEDHEIGEHVDEWRSRIHPEDLDRVLRSVDVYLSKQAPEFCEAYRVQQKDGCYMWILDRGVAVWAEDGTPLRMVGSESDITDRKRTEEALTKALQDLQNITETIPDIMYTLDLGGKVIDWNKRIFSVSGFSPEEMLHRPALAFVPEEERPQLAAAMRRAIEAGSAEVECHLLTKDGRTIPYHWTGAVLKDRDGRAIGMTGVGRDITQMKQAEAAVRESEERYRALIDLSPSGVFVFSEGRTVYVNQMGADIMGAASIEEILNRPTFDFVHPDFHDEVKRNVHRLLTGGATVNRAERVYVKLDGTPVPVQVEAACITWNGKPAILGIFSDISERKGAEEALRTSEEKLRQALQASNTGLWDWNTETGEVRFSKEWKGQLGYGETELPDRFETWESLLHPDDRDRAVAYAQEYRAKPVGAFRQDFRLRHKDGSYRWIDSHASFVAESDGWRVRLLGSHMDITERKWAEEALLQSERELRTVLDALPVGVWFTDATGKVILSNPAGQKIWAGSAGIGIETNEHREEWRQRTQVGIEPHRWALTRALLQGEMSLNETMEIECQGGARKVISNSAVPVKDDAGYVIGAIIVNEDITERKRGEENRAKLAAIVATSYDAIISLSLDSRIQSWNLGADIMFGYATEEMVGQSIAILFPDSRGADVSVAIRRATEGSPVHHVDTCLRRKDGEVLFVSLNVSPIVPQDGTISSISLIARDITDRKRAEEALRASEELFAKAFRSSPYPMVISERDSGRCLDANEAAITLFGYRREEVAGRTSHDLELWQTPQDRSRFIQHLQQAGSIRNCDVMLRDKFGRMRQCLLSAELVELHGKPCMVTVGHDITEKKRAEEELRQSHAFIRQIIDTDPNFIFAKDREGRFTLANKAVADCYGTTVEGLIGKTDADFNPNREEVEFFHRKDLEVMDTLQERFIPEEIITDVAGRRRWLQTVKRPILDEQGHAVMVLGAATDITERKRIEEQLRRRERDLHVALDERERISQDLHDGILQSLYAVALGLEACKPMLTKDPARALDPFQRAVAQLNVVMGEVRGFIAGMDSKPLDTVDLTAALRMMVASITQARAMKVRLALNRQAAGSISRDKAIHLLNVVKEAVSNSLRHGQARHATVSLTMLKQGVRLAIRDDGMGFNPDRITKGHGLENMARRATKMGGRFTVVSKPKSGTRVIVDLPAEAPYAHA